MINLPYSKHVSVAAMTCSPRFASMGSLAASSACACDICQLVFDMPQQPIPEAFLAATGDTMETIE